MSPEDCIDELGGLMIAPPKIHECALPKLSGINNKYQDLIAYKTSCCGEWYRPYYHDTGMYWKKIGKWKLKRMIKKNIIPQT